MPTYDARDLNLNLDKKELRKLYKIQSYKHALAIALNWGLIALAISIAQLWFNPLTYMLAILVIGARMHGLGILMHDAAHYRFLKNKKMNDLMTDIFCMYPIFFDIAKYRRNHLAHHRHLNTEHDPDWAVKLGMSEFQFPKTKREFMLGLLSYFLLYRGVMDALSFLKRFGSNKVDKKKDSSQGLRSHLPKLIFYVTLVAVLSIFNLWGYFAIYWIVPYFSTLFMFQYIRSVAEHFGDLDYDHLLNSTRSVVVLNPIEKFFFAPHNVGFHIEHHLYPGVPFYNLPKLHKMLMELPEYSEKAHLNMGYIRGLFNDLGNAKMEAKLA